MDYTKSFISSFPYFVVTPPVQLAIDLDDAKDHLKLDPSDASINDELTLLIRAVAAYCEKHTSKVLINTTFRTFRDFLMPTLEIRRSPFVSLEAYEYSVSGSFVAVDTDLYYVTQDNYYSKIVLKNDVEYPTDGDEILQMVRIDFIAGYGLDHTSIPYDLYVAMLNHLAALYENRGDCDLASVQSSLPNTSRMIYDTFKIPGIV